MTENRRSVKPQRLSAAEKRELCALRLDGWTQAEIADWLGCHKNTVAKWLRRNGLGMPSRGNPWHNKPRSECGNG